MEPDLERDDGPDASQVNRELTDILVDEGKRMDFTTVTEYAVPDGRLDVVWLWEPPSPIPGVIGAIPVAASRLSRAGGPVST